MEKGRAFLEDELEYNNPSDYGVAAVVLMLYHSFGPSKEKKVSSDSIVYKHLKDDGMELFKLIFDNNSKALVKRFFEHPLVRKLWPKILLNLSPDICFGANGPNMEIEMTFREMTRIIQKEFKLPMPEWWNKLFPELAVPLLQLAAAL